jgi:hypothetical protein
VNRALKRTAIIKSQLFGNLHQFGRWVTLLARVNAITKNKRRVTIGPQDPGHPLYGLAQVGEITVEAAALPLMLQMRTDLHVAQIYGIETKPKQAKSVIQVIVGSVSVWRRCHNQVDRPIAHFIRSN